MRPHHQITADSAWLYRLFTLGSSRVSLTGETIHIEQSHGDVRVKIPVVTISSITIRRSWFWHRLTIQLTDDTERSIGGLDRREAELIRDAALEEAARIRKLAEAEAVRRAEEAARIHKLAVAEAVRRAEEAARIHKLAVAEAIIRARDLSPRLTQLDEELHQLFAGDRYARYRDSLKLHEAIAPTLLECEGLIREHFEQEAKEALGRLEHLEPIKGFEAARKRANSLFVSTYVPAVKDATLGALPNPLTNEQAEAVATDEDATLVLAGAGTGKTSVIVGKVAHLVRNQGVSPDEVLVLAFNRKAADEVRGRLTRDLATANVYTFHAFGLRVIAEVEKTKPILAEESELHDTLKDILNELLDDQQESDAISDFITSYYGVYEPVFDFDTQEDYDEYIRSVDLQSLSGARVRSFEELEIANYLTKRGVKFCYERPYPVLTQTQEFRQYHPDFFLPDYNIYIEHQALDKR